MTRALGLIVSLRIFGSTLALPQSDSRRPTFRDFVVQQIYKGKPAPPILNKDERLFRTAILRGAKKPVEFAGHYTVPICGCGMSCISFSVVDSITGKVYDGYLIELPLTWLDDHPEIDLKPIEDQPSSRLLKINGCLGEGPCGFYDYVMVPQKGLSLIRKELLPDKYQMKATPK
jgi:hypothetical protein